jgi:hypothetical protein
MSWGKDPSKWGKPVTIRFEREQLDLVTKAMQQPELGYAMRRQTLSEFVRSAAVDRAKLMLLQQRHTTAPGHTPARAEPGSVVRDAAGRKTQTSPATADNAGDAPEEKQLRLPVDAAPAASDAKPSKRAKRRTFAGKSKARPPRSRRPAARKTRGPVKHAPRRHCDVPGCPRAPMAKGPLCPHHRRIALRRRAGK